MKNYNIINSVTIMDVMLLIPATFQALLSSSLEEGFNFDLFGYDFFIFLLVGFIPLIRRSMFDKRAKTESIIVLMIALGFVLSLRHINDFYFAHAAIGVEFVFGYLFAKYISYSKATIKVIYIIVMAVFALIFVQQISFSLGLGWFSSGQTEVELVDGLYRVGTTAGSSTFTGIFLVLLIGILVVLSNNNMFQYILLFMGLLSIITTGTRSAIIVIVLMGIFMVFRKGKRKSTLIYKIVGLIAFLIYLLPTLQSIIDARNEAAGDDITSGRTERWEQTFKYMEKDYSTYFWGNGGGTLPISNYCKNVKTLASPHNSYIGIFFEFGVLGIVLLILFLYKKVKVMFGHYTIGFVAFIGSLLVCWNSEVVALSFLYSFFFWLLYFVELSTYKIESIKKKSKYEKNSIYQYA